MKIKITILDKISEKMSQIPKSLISLITNKRVSNYSPDEIKKYVGSEINFINKNLYLISIKEPRNTKKHHPHAEIIPIDTNTQKQIFKFQINQFEVDGNFLKNCQFQFQQDIIYTTPSKFKRDVCGLTDMIPFDRSVFIEINPDTFIRIMCFKSFFNKEENKSKKEESKITVHGLNIKEAITEKVQEAIQSAKSCEVIEFTEWSLDTIEYILETFYNQPIDEILPLEPIVITPPPSPRCLTPTPPELRIPFDPDTYCYELPMEIDNDWMY